MAATNFSTPEFSEGEGEVLDFRPAARPARKRRRIGPGGRVGIAAVIVAIVCGFAIGRAVDPAPRRVSPSLVSPQEIASAAANTAQSIDDRGFSQLENGIQHTHTFQQSVDPATQKLLSHQMDLTRQVALQFPTYKDAVRGGLHRAGPFSPGLGTHMINYGNIAYGAGKTVLTDDQIRHPLAWIYDGTKPDSPVVGLFYETFTKNPAGFAGPNDVWHYHKNVCITRAADGGIDAPLGADRDVTKVQCNAVGGTLLPLTPGLLHVWSVPGYEDPQGVFAHLNPAITCDDGTYHVVNMAKIGTRLSACVDGTE
jgi:hypothetical protein